MKTPQGIGRSGNGWDGGMAATAVGLVGGWDDLPAVSPARGPVEWPVSGENQWLTWQRRLCRQMLVVAGLYATAHMLFGLHWLEGGARALTDDLRFAEALFGVGVLLLGMVTRTLNDPVAARHARAQAQAGGCLLAVAALACSPCIWWFVFRT